MTLKEITINCGHTITGKGTGAIGVVHETIKNREVLPYIKSAFEKRGVKVNVVNFYNSENQLVDIVQKANMFSNSQLFISLHLNAFDGKANGVECYYMENNIKTKNYANKICDQLSFHVGWKNRGAKIGAYYVLKNLKYDALLLELGFCDNVEDMKKWNNERIALSIVNGVLGEKYEEEPKPLKTYRVQVGLFHEKQNAVNLCQELKKKGYDCYIIE